MAFPIVAGVDGSDQALRAVEWAAGEAAGRGRRLRLVHVVPEPTSAVPGAHSVEQEAGEGLLAEAAATARDHAPELEVETALLPGVPHTVLLAEAERADVMVVGNRGAGRVVRLLAGSVGSRVTGHAACPVVAVREAPGARYDEIVVGVDGSGYAAAAVAFALEEAALRQCRLRAVHAWTPAPPFPPTDVVTLQHETDDRAREAQRVVAEALAGWRTDYPDVEAVQDLVFGHPAPALVKASERADLLVVGSRGRSGARGVALGSVSQAVLRRARCPVAVTRRPL